MDSRSLRGDIPINLPKIYLDEALALRNKLLLYRFRTFGTKAVSDDLIDPTIEPRFNQILAP
ncbi:MAG: hypothetical protein ACYTG7_25485, partial [Planctomycetota bacterium]